MARDADIHYRYVDLIRGAAAIAVVIVHYRWFFATKVEQWVSQPDARLPLYWLLKPAYERGGLAVPMFWMLSGFVFFAAYGGNRSDISMRNFWVNRLARLYPLHIATLILVILLQELSMQLYGHWQIYGNNDPAHLIRQIFLASNWFTHEPSFNGPIWSVSVEILVYAMFAVVLKLFGMRTHVLLAIAALFVIIEQMTGNSVAWCAALFFIGCLIGKLSPNAYQVLGKKLLPVSALLMAISGLTVVAIYLVMHGISPPLISYIVMPALLFLLASMDLTLKPPPKSLWQIGAITYAVYLVHMPLTIGLKTVLPNIFSSYVMLRNPITLIIYITLVVAISLIVHRYFELPMQILVKRHLLRRRSRGAPHITIHVREVAPGARRQPPALNG